MRFSVRAARRKPAWPVRRTAQSHAQATRAYAARLEMTIAMLLAVALQLPCTAVHADIVQTASQRYVGEAKLTNNGLNVAGKAVAWSDVLYAGLNSGRATLPQPHVLWVEGGDRLAGRVLAVSSREVVLVHPLLDEVRISRDQAVAVDLQPGLPPPAAPTDEGVLMRVTGEPLPGDLLWLDADKVGIDSVLGAIELPVSDVTRYVFPARKGGTPPTASVSVRLLDGSALRGEANVQGDTVALKHPALGTLQLPLAGVRTVFYRDRAWFVGAGTPVTKATPLVGSTTATPDVLSVRHDAETGMGVIDLRADATATVALPPAMGRGATLRTALAPAHHNRGTVKLTLRSGSTTLAEHIVRPGDAPHWLTATLPPGAKDLTVATELVPPLQWPAAITLIEPVAFSSPPTPNAQPPTP